MGRREEGKMGSRYDGKVLIFDSMESYHIPEDSLELNIGEEARDNYRTVQQLEVYQVSLRVAEDVWTVVLGWDWMAKDTVGKQWIRATDSIAANISEGYGRYSFKENLRFCYYARGSLSESLTWLEKASNRRLLPPQQSEEIKRELQKISGLLNGYIRYVRSHIDK